jgi:serine/threonine-protein kinase
MRRALDSLRAMIGRGDQAPPQAQARLGRWRLERELARGSTGSVWLARSGDDEPPVAIKTIAFGGELAGDELALAKARFRQEARAAQRLEHADIVRVYDVGETGALAWIVMEFVRGRDLTRYCEPRRLLPPPLALAIGARIARALAHAHSRGVVHRDVKPANVIVDLPANVVKVADFGVAHLADAERSRSGQVLGTPSYMAPEQLAGRKVDGRADLYALGVMLFQLFAGRLPHEADTIGALLQQIANEPAPDLHRVRPELPQSLAQVVALALEKRPEVRYADGTQLADDLDAVAAELETEPRADVTSARRGGAGAEGD